MSIWVVLVYALAVARVTGLISLDEITVAARCWVIEHLPLNRLGIALEYLVTCPWCVSIWVATAAVPLIWCCGDQAWLFAPAAVGALSQFTGMTSALGRPVTR